MENLIQAYAKACNLLCNYKYRTNYTERFLVGYALWVHYYANTWSIGVTPFLFIISQKPEHHSRLPLFHMFERVRMVSELCLTQKFVELVF